MTSVSPFISPESASMIGGALSSRIYVPAAIGDPPMSVSGALRSARALLAEPGRWCRLRYFMHPLEGAPSNTKRKEPYIADPYSGDWCCCAIGALQCVTFGLQFIKRYDGWYAPGLALQLGYGLEPHGAKTLSIYNGAFDLLRHAAERLGGWSPIGINDDATDVGPVLRMYDEALALSDG